ncbi:TlpA family protein disulfide reductase [Seonamhaeicola maritimus]|uniref:TlpA family protein disulfide reductase n=1 Tax=Seonamhaeicola maritimus TaxID=2591822 RepID=UPI002494AA66|nr:TlpA disulfide reductase family protein [Seonamhaeicola maritimus]
MNLLKKNTVIILLLSIFTTTNGIAQEKNTFKVSGTLPGLDVPYMFIDYNDDDTGDRVWDTLYIKNEYFSYSAKIKNTKRIAIWPLLARPKKNGQGVKGGNIAFLVSPGDNIEFKGNVTETFNAIPTGTSLCDDLNAYNKSVAELNQEMSAIDNRARQFKYDDPMFRTIYDSIGLVQQKVKVKKMDFIRANPKSEVAAFYLEGMVQKKSIEDDEALSLLNVLDEKLSTSPFYITVATRLKGSEATKVGNMVPEVVTTRTLDGSTFDLKSLRGKHVMIDFWGTWCGPCIQEMPTVKAYSEKYKDKLVIIGIDSGDTKDRIMNFVAKNDYKWLQLMSKKGIGSDNFVAKFNVNGFPTKFIIDPEGKIIGRYVGGSEEAFNLLDEVLK